MILANTIGQHMRREMPFNAHDLTKAFEDGRRHERQRILKLLKDNTIGRKDTTDDARLQYNWYVKEFNKEDHWDIGEL